MPTFVIGDLHGQLEAFNRLLRDAGLADSADRWTGADTTLVLIGDFVDRGPYGLACVDLAMRLQTEASAAGGRLLALLGNHDLILLAAHRFPDHQAGIGLSLRDDWLRSGGEPADLRALTPTHVAWLQALPALVRLDDALFVHGDIDGYLDFGRSVEAVNTAFQNVLQGDDPGPFEALLTAFSQHEAFENVVGKERAEHLLETFGGSRLVHGHTPISEVLEVAPADVTEARVYHQGLCVNVDGGLYLGGPGFVYTLP